jgi:hypothetical protein
MYTAKVTVSSEIHTNTRQAACKIFYMLVHKETARLEKVNALGEHVSTVKAQKLC